MKTKEQYQSARAVLESLIHGLDPESKVELPQKEVINRVEVNRSMLTALDAIEQVEARISRRSHLPGSVGKVWSDEEESQLKAEFAESMSIRTIALNHNRTVRAIEARLETLGLLMPDRKTTSGRYTRSAIRRNDE